MLEKNSGGRFILETKVGLYPPQGKSFTAVMAGRVEIGWERTPWLAGTFPLWDLSLPFFWDDVFEYESFLNDPRMQEIDPEDLWRKRFGQNRRNPVGHH